MGKRYVHEIEKRQIEILKKRKDNLIYEFIGACENINEQIKDVRSGKWIKEIRGEVDE